MTSWPSQSNSCRCKRCSWRCNCLNRPGSSSSRLDSSGGLAVVFGRVVGKIGRVWRRRRERCARLGRNGRRRWRAGRTARGVDGRVCVIEVKIVALVVVIYPIEFFLYKDNEN
ncbi:hypothetical protein BpHYR1_036655 [Brachionus plicatilis]|uniref:Uncharacterized protein n=1 Tax=Brachionus plicatilis TaxID=10195 RepID=A0A3M7SN32_BRAPC|nr:hypothetical protein BpHYR1_036655 [Brachionus plicatilis]